MPSHKSKYFKHPKAIVAKGAQIGEGTRLWAFVNVQKGAVIGKNCNVCDGCFVEKGAVVGDRVTLKNGVNVFEGVTLENDVFVGSHTVFINDRYPRSHKADWVLEPVQVRQGATLGSNTTILCGITIGQYALTGAGSVVTRDVSPHGIVTGNPARLVGYACRCGHKLGKDLSCSCGQKYILEQGQLKTTS